MAAKGLPPLQRIVEFLRLRLFGQELVGIDRAGGRLNDLRTAMHSALTTLLQARAFMGALPCSLSPLSCEGMRCPFQTLPHQIEGNKYYSWREKTDVGEVVEKRRVKVGPRRLLRQGLRGRALVRCARAAVGDGWACPRLLLRE
jgi:hypothetical protein